MYEPYYVVRRDKDHVRAYVVVNRRGAEITRDSGVPYNRDGMAELSWIILTDHFRRKEGFGVIDDDLSSRRAVVLCEDFWLEKLGMHLTSGDRHLITAGEVTDFVHWKELQYRHRQPQKTLSL